MRNIIFVASMLIGTMASAQKVGTFETVGNKKIRGNLTEYITKNGISFKVGDTLYLGYPHQAGTFAHVLDKSDAIASAFAGVAPLKLTSTYSGHMIVIKQIKAYQRKIQVTTYGRGESKATYVNNFESALELGEVLSPKYMTSDIALETLKKTKDKLDLGLIDQSEYEEIKEALKKYIK